jgi:AraC-like DNA-binding protein
MEIILHLAGRFEELTAEGWRRQPRMLVSGQITRPVTVRPAGEVFTVGVRLKSWAGGPLLREHASRLTDRLVELEAVNQRLARALRPLLACDEVTPEALDSALGSLAGGGDAVDRRICSAVARVERACGRGAVDSLHQHTGIGNRQLERLFQDHVGVGPKLFARMVRFRSVLRAVSATSTPKWAEVAAEYGYADQAHLIRDFQQFAGCTPRALWQEASSLNLQFACAG